MTTKPEFSNQDDQMMAQLVNLAEGTQPDPAFADALEATLRAEVARSTFAQPTRIQRGLNMNAQVRRFASIAAVLALITLATLTVPPLRAFAQVVLDSLFNRAPDVQVFEEPVTFLVNPTPVLEIAPPTAPLTVEQAEAQAGFDVKAPSYLPEGYTLTSVTYDPGAPNVSLFYQRGDYALNMVQIPADQAYDLGDIGEGAHIQTVQVGDITAEFVQGMWTMDSTRQGDTLSFEGRVWDSSFPWQQMRWIDDGIYYWMSTPVGQLSDLTVDEWAQIAASLQ